MRSQAASMFAAMAVITMATPGKMDSHQAVCRYWRPWDTSRPQLTSGGWMPMPRKHSEDSASMT